MATEWLFVKYGGINMSNQPEMGVRTEIEGVLVLPSEIVISDSILDKALSDDSSKEYALCVEIFGSKQKIVEYQHNKFYFKLGE